LVLALGVLATVLALVKNQIWPDLQQTLPQGIKYYLTPPGFSHLLLILIPITTAGLLAMVNRFKWGQQWIFLRNATEAVKREFYRYWTGTGAYRPAESGEASRQVKLAEKLEHINEQLLQTEVNLTALSPPVKPFPFQFTGLPTGPDGYSILSPAQYLNLRLEEQLTYYRKEAVSLEKKLKRLHWGIYLFGGLGTLLAAINHEIWVAATTAMVTAFTSYLGFMQVENTLKAYNQAAAGLADVFISYSRKDSNSARRLPNPLTLTG